MISRWQFLAVGFAFFAIFILLQAFSTNSFSPQPPASQTRCIELARFEQIMNDVIGRIALLDEKMPKQQIRCEHARQELQNANNWSSGIAFELDHHRKWVCGVDCYGPVIGEGWFKYERETKLKGEPIEPHRSRICHLLKNYYADPHHVRVMVDHGAGPFTNLGKWFTCPEDVWSGVGAQVIAVDPLASGYNSILNEFHIHNTLRTSYCKSEILSTCIGKSVADFAVIVNALDHSENPMLGFIESLRVGSLFVL